MGALAERAKATRLGAGLDPDTQLGPLVSAEQRERVMSYIDSGREQGAELLTGGEAALADSGGYFVAPTLFSATSDELRIAREEIFGPVLVASPYDTLEEVAAARQRRRLRAGRGRVDARRRQRPPPRRDAARRLGLHQPLGAGRIRRRRSAASRPPVSVASTATTASTPTWRRRPSGPRCEPRGVVTAAAQSELGLATHALRAVGAGAARRGARAGAAGGHGRDRARRRRRALGADPEVAPDRRLAVRASASGWASASS